MSILETKHKKKSALITSILLVLIVFGIFNFGLQYLDPPTEYGVAINFGDVNSGKGNEVVKSNIQPKKNPANTVEKKREDTSSEEVVKEKVITQNTKDAPIIKNVKEKDAKIENEVIEKPKELEKPKPSKETQDALNNLLKGNSNSKSKSEGDDGDKGDKGSDNGDPNSNKYYGNDGLGGDSNYNLSGRKALSKPIEKPECNEEGLVVVSIEVDNNGKVIKATAGVKGTTNSASCLLKPAREAALKTTWNPDPKAPSKQRGTIVYRFSLSE